MYHLDAWIHKIECFKLTNFYLIIRKITERINTQYLIYGIIIKIYTNN